MRKLTHAEIAAKRKSPEDMQNIKRNPIYGVCDNIRSIFNVGAIFRTSDGALIEKLYLTGYTPYPPRKEIEKVALGATETVPWEYRQSTLQAVEEIRSMVQEARRKVGIAKTTFTPPQMLSWCSVLSEGS